MAHTPHKHTTHTLTYTEKSFVNTQLSTDLYKLTYSVSHQSTISTSILYTTEKYNSPLLSFHSYAIFNTEIYIRRFLRQWHFLYQEHHITVPQFTLYD